jgi:hypothetical protein
MQRNDVLLVKRGRGDNVTFALSFSYPASTSKKDYSPSSMSITTPHKRAWNNPIAKNNAFGIMRHLCDSNTRSRRNWLTSVQDERLAGQRVNHSAKVPEY